MLSFQVNTAAAATSSFASHPWGHYPFFLIVGVTAMSRILPPSLSEKRAEALRAQGRRQGASAVSPALLHQGSEWDNPSSQDRQGIWETHNCPRDWEQPIMVFSYLSSLRNCGFRHLLNGPLLPQVLIISGSSLSWPAAKAESEASD